MKFNSKLILCIGFQIMYHAIQIRGVVIFVLGTNTVLEERISNTVVSIISHVLKIMKKKLFKIN